MAYTYATMFPVEVGHDFYADQLNFIRTAISRRATLSGATVTLPAVMADDEVIDTDDVLFYDWLLAARTAVETILLEDFFHYWYPSVSPGGYKGFGYTWTKSIVLTYVHATWSSTYKPASTTTNWYPYTPSVSTNEFYRGYVNELYYVLECLSIYEIANTIPATGNAQDAKSGNATDTGGSRFTAYTNSWVNFFAASYAAQTGANQAMARVHYSKNFNPPYYASSTVDNQKVTGGHIVIPDETYALIQLFIPWRDMQGGAGGHLTRSVACTEGTNVAEFGGVWTGNNWNGFYRVTGDFDNETIHMVYSWPSMDTASWGYTGDADDDNSKYTFPRNPASAEYEDKHWGRSGFDGYCNSAYPTSWAA